MSRRLKYDNSFKEQAIQLALSSDQAISKTALDLGIQEQTLYAWVRDAKAKTTAASDKGLSVEKLHEELLKLRKDNHRLKETCEILKKATAYFANSTKQDTHS